MARKVKCQCQTLLYRNFRWVHIHIKLCLIVHSFDLINLVTSRITARSSIHKDACLLFIATQPLNTTPFSHTFHHSHRTSFPYLHQQLWPRHGTGEETPLETQLISRIQGQLKTDLVLANVIHVYPIAIEEFDNSPPAQFNHYIVQCLWSIGRKWRCCTQVIPFTSCQNP